MGIVNELVQLALDAANDVQARKAQLEHQRRKLHSELAIIEAKIDAIGDPYQLSQDFALALRGHLSRRGSYLCYRCFFAGRREIELQPDAGTPEQDIFRCRECGLEVVADA